MHTLYLKSTDSRYATPEELEEAGITNDQIPRDEKGQWRMMAHQAATVRALRYGDSPIIINQAMTGDGKSLAGQFAWFNDCTKTFTMYPTNELARDQLIGLNKLRETWKPDSIPHVVINADELDVVQEALSGTRSETVKRLLDGSPILTNPDIFHLITQFAYKKFGAAPDHVLAPLMNHYELYVHDEFHLFDIAETASVMISLLLLLQVSKEAKQPRFLFLSATPQPCLTQLARQAGLKIETIAGNYQDGFPIPPPGWRRILQPVTLNLHEGKLVDWVEEHLEDVILSFFRAHSPSAKGVIIAGGIASAHRLYHYLKSLCEPQIQVRLNTGLVPLPERSRDYDLLIATSTVDVGVDFRINLLIFESFDAASHLQRLGRLGRHEDDGNGNRFSYYEAHALLPSWVIEPIKATPTSGNAWDRESYSVAIVKAFPRLQNFERYLNKWAGVQAEEVLTELTTKVIKQQYRQSISELKETYHKLFSNKQKHYFRLLKSGHSAIHETVTSFRGSDPFTALILDVSRGSELVKPYSLLPLLRDVKLEDAGVDWMINYAVSRNQNVKALERSKPLVGYKLLGWLPESRQLRVIVNFRLGPEDECWVIERRGFSLEVNDSIPGFNSLNQRIEERPLAVRLVFNEKPADLRRKCRIGRMDLFPFYSPVGNKEGTIAFGRDATLLDSILNPCKKTPGDEPIVC